MDAYHAGNAAPSPEASTATQAWLPRVARYLAEQGFTDLTPSRLAAACGTDAEHLTQHWPDHLSLVTAAIEYAYDTAERVWQLLLRPGAALPAHLLASGDSLGGDFSLARLFAVGNGHVAEPRVRATLRRMNRRLAQFLAQEVAALHLATLAGDDGDEVMRAQIGTVLRRLAHIQQEADELADDARAALFEELNSAVADAAPAPRH